MTANKGREERKIILFMVSSHHDKAFIFPPKTEKLEPYVAATWQNDFYCESCSNVCWYNYGQWTMMGGERRFIKSFFLCARPIMKANRHLPGEILMFYYKDQKFLLN